MSLASYTDANRFLDETKVKFDNAQDAEPESKTADRLVRASLFPVFGSVVTTWALNPQTDQVAPPEIITDIAAMLMAAERFEKLYSLEELGQSDFSARRRALAMDLLSKLHSGELGLDDESYVSGATFDELSFWPNNTTTIMNQRTQDYIEAPDPPLRSFKMSQEF